MRRSLLELLRCPFCGGVLQADSGPVLEWRAEDLRTGVLYCECCAYPVVDGIPYLRAGHEARAVLQQLELGQAEAAQLTLLGLESEPAERWQSLIADPDAFTFRRALEALCADAEDCYFLYRFSDPTYLVSETLLRSLDAALTARPGRALDLGGGTGHLSRCLAGLRGVSEVVLADRQFWKLWLAREFVAPASQPVCCDANAPLPFARDMFGLALCSDAMNYLWQRRLAVDELCRLLAPDGILLATHLHNALCENPSAGMPLSPAGWRRLFETLPVRLYQESAVLEAWLADGELDLGGDATDAELADEPSLLAVATSRAGVCGRHAIPELDFDPRQLAINPLYMLEQSGPPQVWRRRFPSPEYAAEFATCTRYLAERFELSAAYGRQVENSRPEAALQELARQRMLLALPNRYL